MSAKSLSPLLGYNNNVRHKGRIFHVQTEDSGVRYGHIITHLFVDGGRILKSVKTSYTEYVESDRRAEIVRDMMKQQHKAMFIALRDGRFDAALEGGDATKEVAVKAPPPVPPPIAPPQRASPGRYALSEAPPAVVSKPSHPAPAGPLAASQSSRTEAEAVATSSPIMGRAAAPARGASPAVRRPAGGSSTASVDRRPGMTRPTASAAQAPQRSRSVFGGDLVDEQTLDEVILSYLAAEVEAEDGKK